MIKIMYNVQLMMILTFAYANAQNEIPATVRANNFSYRIQQMGGNFAYGHMIAGLPSGDIANVIGDSYWDKHWGQSSLLMYNRTEPVEGYFTRYDIQKNEFEFKLDNTVKVLSGNLVKDFIWLDSVSGTTRFLINARDLEEDGVKASGFLELLVEGKNSLYKKISIEILKPDFSPALNVGSTDVRILKKEKFYYNNGKSLIQIKSKKSLTPLTDQYGQKVNQFIDNNTVKLNKEADLIRLFKFLTNE